MVEPPELKIGENSTSSCLASLHRKPYPKQIIVDIHSYCNARCLVCPYWGLSKKLPMGVMEEDLFDKLINDYSTLTRKYDFRGHVLFCNMGELFVFPKIVFDRIRRVLDAGLDFDIQTNAGALTPKMVDRLLETGFSGSILISCHGISPWVYKKIMKLSLPVTLKHIEYLIRKYPKEKICIQSIPHRWPRGEARRVKKFWRQKGIRVRMPLPNNRGGLLPQIAIGLQKKLVACAAGRPMGEMVVCYNGDVILCCNDMAQNEKIGSLRENSIEEVWNGPIMLERLEQIYCGRPSPSGFICKKCEFGLESNSKFARLGRNISYELRKFFYTRVW